ncbi:MAG: redox protein [Chitinophagales bacterium]|nr:MAG: redox protein [Chitinophagales bacterium]
MSPTAIVTYHTRLSTSCVHVKSGQTISTDAPTDNHGQGQAFSPTDLTATSLASCMLTVMGIYAERQTISLEGSTAQVFKKMADHPRRIASIIIEMTLPASIPHPERPRLEFIARNCPVAKSLHPEIIQDIRFTYKEA